MTDWQLTTKQVAKTADMASSEMNEIAALGVLAEFSNAGTVHTTPTVEPEH